MDTVTISVTRVVTTTDDLGNSTETTTQEAIPGCLFEPQQSTERTDSRSPGVITPAKFYAPVALPLDADDVVTDESGVQWQVVGGSAVWGDQTEVPVKRIGST